MLTLTLDKFAPQSLYRQVYDGIRLRILDGTLVAGQKLPSSRELARHLCISRTIASLSYQLLESEGYICSRPAVGTFVSSEIPDASMQAQSDLASADEKTSTNLKVSKLAGFVQEQGVLSFQPLDGLIKLGTNSPSVSDFPLDLWRQISSRVIKECGNDGNDALAYSSMEGCLPLKSALVSYLNVSRAVKCTEDQIIICAGSRHALNLVARAQLDAGDLVGIEEPVYGGAKQAFQACRAELRGIPVDSSGLVTARLNDLPEELRLIYVTPSHQYPLGSTLSLQRRLELLHWANRNSALVIEDDYDSEFRYGERPIPSLQGLDANGRVVYIGTFSKTVFPALRIGYIVAPPSLAALYKQMQQALYGQIPYLDQLILARFLSEGHFERHVRRMRTIYERRRNLAKQEFLRVQRGAEIVGDNAGMAFVLRLSELDQEKLLKRMALAGIQLRSTREFYVSNKMPGSELIIGYGGLQEEQIKYCARTLKRVLSELGTVQFRS